jgi:hypothetical protein
MNAKSTVRQHPRIAVATFAAVIAAVVAVGITSTRGPSVPTSTVTCANNLATDIVTLQAGVDADYYGVLTIAAGTCQLAGGTPLTVRKPEIIDGAGQNATFLVQALKQPGINVRSSANPFTLENIHLDSATNNPGIYGLGQACDDTGKGQVLAATPGVLYSAADNTTLYKVTALSGCAFGIRIVGQPGQPCTAQTTHGTHVDHVTVIAPKSAGGFTPLDIDCTNGGSVSNVTIVGNFLALYYDANVTLTGETYRHGLVAKLCQQPFSVSAPSDHVAINTVVSDAGPGTFHTANGAQNLNDTVTNDTYNLACAPINGP